MIFDFDDFHESNHRLDLFWKLKRINPAFRCTVFAVPGCGSDDFWSSVPDWMELAVHGWEHPHPWEALKWSYKQTCEVLDHSNVRKHFVQGFKAPGWQISDATYKALLDRGWWVADMAYNDARRPAGLRVYKLGPDSWHGHIQNVIKYENGLEETFDRLSVAVEKADSFQFVSEVVT
jgi:hypothetical protein